MNQHPDLRARIAADPPYRLFAALWGGLALVDMGRAAHAPAPVQVALLVVLAAACCVDQGVGTALAVAVTVWLVVTGFVVNTDGHLRLGGPGDLLRLVVLGLAALAARGVRR